MPDLVDLGSILADKMIVPADDLNQARDLRPTGPLHGVPRLYTMEFTACAWPQKIQDASRTDIHDFGKFFLKACWPGLTNQQHVAGSNCDGPLSK